MLARLRQHPFLAALLIGLAAEILFLVHLGRPDILMFDEVHYVPAARALLALREPMNIEHPMLAKEFMALGIALFGDHPFGWRFFSTIAGSASVMGVFAILWLLYRRLRTAAFGAFLAIVGNLVFIQARIAMLDTYFACFLTLAIAAMLWAMLAPAPHVKWRLALTAMLLGLATGAKWAAVPYVAFAGIAFLTIRLSDARRAGQPLARALSGSDQRHWPGTGAVSALLILGLGSILVYFLTFAPGFFFTYDPVTLNRILPLQLQMYRLQTQVLPSHPYQSDWWSWPLMLRPIWYLYEVNMGAQRGVMLLGNPVVMWGGLVAVAACLWTGIRDRARRPLGIALLWIASVAIFAIIPKSLGFYYYYYPSSIFLCLAIPAAFARFGKGRFAAADEWFGIAALAMFIYFYPIISAAPLAGHDSFLHWTWFMRWR